jgi:hypothetical protein
MRTLTRIERLPHTFIAEAKIHKDELTSAIIAYSNGKEYESINPYVSRFDEVVSPFQPPATKIYLKYGLAQSVFELWRELPDLFSQDIHHSELLSASRELDRSRPDHRRHDLNFAEYIRRTLPQVSIPFPANGVETLADWVWASPYRCPAIRLGYEVYHQILRNLTDKAGKADMGDLSHVGCLPYVDAMTLDRRMRNYVAQADRALCTDYSSRVFEHFEQLRGAV